MGKELEVKVLNINKDEIIKKLESINAKLIKREHQVNKIFDFEDRYIKDNHKGYMRIREKVDLLRDKKEYILTLKKNVSNDGVRENIEIETNVTDSESLEKILLHLKLKKVHQGSKERISYTLDGILFEIDTWDKDTYPEPYLEIEVKDKKELDRAIKILDLKKDNVTSKSIGQLRMEKGLSDL